MQADGLSNVRGSRYLRPYTPSLRSLEQWRLHRIVAAVEEAAKSNRLIHLWWHPEDMGPHPDENLAFLRCILQAFQRCRHNYGMRSLCMRDVAATVSAAPPPKAL